MLSKKDSEAKCEVCGPDISEPSAIMACFVLNSAGECVQNSFDRGCRGTCHFDTPA